MPEAGIEEILKRLGSRDSQDAWDDFLRAYSADVFQVVRRFEADPDAAADCFQMVCQSLVANRFHRLRKFKPEGPAKFSTWLRAVVRNLCLDWHRKQFGRRRLFKSMERLSAFDREVFRILYQKRVSAEQSLALLNPDFPQVTSEQIAESRERIENHLSERQHWLLGLWAGTAEFQSTDDPQTEIRVTPNLVDPNPDPEKQVIAADQRERLRRALEALEPRERLLVRLRFEQELSLEQCAKLQGLGNAQRADRQIKDILWKLRNKLG